MAGAAGKASKCVRYRNYNTYCSRNELSSNTTDGNGEGKRTGKQRAGAGEGGLLGVHRVGHVGPFHALRRMLPVWHLLTGAHFLEALERPSIITAPTW